MALASFPARYGQQRSLHRIFQVLSWAFALSPGARSFAWARLASFCGPGLALAFARNLRPGAAQISLIGQDDEALAFEFVQHAPYPLGLLVVDRG
jgi:hypothetical protein